MRRSPLLVAIVLLSLMMLFQLWELAGSGAFYADYFYLPLRELVSPDRHDEMERIVIERWDALVTRKAALSLAVHGIVLLCVLVAYRNALPKTTGEVNDR